MPTYLWDGTQYVDVATGAPYTPAGAHPEGWDLLYQTDFATNDGWVARTETQANDNSYNHPDNVSYGERGLVILGKRENRGGRPFTTGDVLGQHITVPNYFRADVTATLPTDYGMWPCPLWFRPLNSNNGEIDLCETWTYDWGANPRSYSTIHDDYANNRHESAQLAYSALPDTDPGAPHTYTCIKTEGAIEFLIDGVRVYKWQTGATYNAGQKVGPPPAWYDSIFEVTDRTWYPRVTLQLGGANTDDPPPEWTQSEVIVHDLRIYRPATEGRGTFAIIGDSLTYQGGNGEANIRGILQANGWAAEDIYWYGVNGKGIDYRDSEGGLTVEQVAAAKSQLGTVDTWVIALGTNGAATYGTEAVQNILDAIGPGGRMYWFGTGNRDASPQYAAFNTMAQPVVEAAGGTWLDYQTFASTLPSNYWNTDGLHMPPQGYAARNQFMIDHITGS